MPFVLKKAVVEFAIIGISKFNPCFKDIVAFVARTCLIKVLPTLPIPNNMMFMVVFMSFSFKNWF